MRIAILSYTFPKGMGYIGNMLPRHLARLGAEVHYVTMDLPHYFQNAMQVQSYGNFQGLEVQQPGSIEKYDGFTLHGLGHRRLLGQMRYVGLKEKLQEIRPDIVQSLLATGWPALDAALLQRRMEYRLFTANHTTVSVFPLAQRKVRPWNPSYLKNLGVRTLPGRFISSRTVKCYAATTDCAEVAVRFFGVEPLKVDVIPLGVDTDAFHPVRSETERDERAALRAELGCIPQSTLAIYTGQFTDAKNPLLLARAIEQMIAGGKPVRGLFIGAGPQGEGIARCRGAVVLPFMPNEELPRFYRAADIGVWPTQESTSMLDAAASGLPIVVNDTLQAVERIRGNGCTYRLNDLGDLVRVLERLMDATRRQELGEIGARRMEQEFSWRDLAARRLKDYERALAHAPRF